MVNEFLYITKTADIKIRALLSENTLLDLSSKTSVRNSGVFFRIEVKGGGCYGYTYDYSVDSEFDEEYDLRFVIDDTFESNDERYKLLCISGSDISSADKFSESSLSLIVSDCASMSMISGSTLDYKIELGGEEFVIVNPKASSKCGCGVSFSI
jgi:Fe-S cluster assembly iron-binding protein IscA